MDGDTIDRTTEQERQRLATRDANIALGCSFAIALLVVCGLIIYLWTL